MHLFEMTLAALFLAVSISPVCAEEGMWTPNNFPADQVEKAYGFKPDQGWLDHVRLSSLRLARGCSASFVSPYGLVQTNHHCARACIQQLSTKTKDFVASGFYARGERTRSSVPTSRLNQLIDITDVTDRINKATAGKDGQAFADAMKAERASNRQGMLRQRRQHPLRHRRALSRRRLQSYRYRRYQDVRLVFAPEEAIAFFGGDPDNFEFPRYDLDVSYLRVYRDGSPLDSNANYLRYAAADAQPGRSHFHVGSSGRDPPTRYSCGARIPARRDAAARYFLPV